MHINDFCDIFFAGFLLCILFIWLNSQQLWIGNKNLRDQPQTLHRKSVSRYGGIALYASFFLLGLQHENNEFLIFSFSSTTNVFIWIDR